MPDNQNDKLASMLEDLQTQLSSCNDIHERTSLRAAIRHLRATQDLLNPGSNLRRSRRKYKPIDHHQSSNADNKHVRSTETTDNAEKRKQTSNCQPTFISDPVHIEEKGIVGAPDDKKVASRIEKRLQIPPDPVLLQSHLVEESVQSKNKADNQELSLEPGFESSRRRSRPSLSHIFKIKSPKSPKESDSITPLTSPSPADSKEEFYPFGKRRFSKRFGKRASKATLEIPEVEDSQVASNNLHSHQSPSSDADQAVESSKPPLAELPSSSSETQGGKPSTNLDSHHKHSARVRVKRAIGRFFPAKHKNSSEESKSNPSKLTSSMLPASSLNESDNQPDVSNYSVKSRSFHPTVRSASTLPDIHKNAAKLTMTEVLHQPLDVAASPDINNLSAVKNDSTTAENPTYELKTEAEEQDNNSESNHFKPDCSSDSVKLNEEVSLKETNLADDNLSKSEADKSLSVTSSHTSSSPSPAWAPEKTKKSSFRSVFTPTSITRPPTCSENSSPPLPKSEENSTSNVSSTNVDEELKSSSSRFGKRELSASFKTYRPTTYTPPQHIKSRTESFRLTRPKHFLKQTTSDKSSDSEALNPLESSSNTSSTPLSSHNKEFPTNLSPINPLLNSKSSSLQRSESCKENRNRLAEGSPAFPFLSGSKNRSQRILSRVLSLKIDSEKANKRREAILGDDTKQSENQAPLQPPSISLQESSSFPNQIKTDLIDDKRNEFHTNQENSASLEVEVTKDKESLEEAEKDTSEEKISSEESSITETDNESSASSVTDVVESTFNLVDFVKELIEQVELLVHPSLVVDKEQNSLEISPSRHSLSQEDNSSSTEPLTSPQTKEELNHGLSETSCETSQVSADIILSEKSDTTDQKSLTESCLEERSISPEISEVEPNLEESKEMEGRSVLINRRSGRGSVKSRILSSESWITNSGKGSDPKKTPHVDTRMFRSTEGIRSRMNKFSSSPTSPPTSTVKTVKVAKSPDRNNNMNGDVVNHSVKTEKKLLISTDNNETQVKETKTITETKVVITNGQTKQSESVQSPTSPVQIKSIQTTPNVRVINNSTVDKSTLSNSTDNSSKPLAVDKNNDKLPQGDVKDVNGVSTEASDLTEEISEDIKVTVNSTDTSSETIKNSAVSPAVDSSPPPVSPPSQLRQTDVNEDARVESQPTRSRRLRSSSKSTSGSTSPSGDAKNTSAAPGASEPACEVVESNQSIEVPVTAPRRRRRVRKSSDKVSTSSSAATTPDREVEVFASPKPSSPLTLPSTPVKSVSQSPVSPSSISPKSSVIVEESRADDHVTADVIEEKKTNDVTIRSTENKSDDIKVKDERPKLEVVNDREEKTKENPAVKREPASITPVEVKEKIVVKSEKTTKEADKKMAPQSEQEVRFTIDNVEDCTDESTLRKMLDQTTGVEDRMRIRAVIRVLKNKKTVEAAEKFKPTSPSYSWGSNSFSVQQSSSLSRSKSMRTDTTRFKSGMFSNKSPTPATFDRNALANKYSFTPTTSSSVMSSGTKKVGSIFDREDDPPKPKSNQSVDKKREIVRNRSMPSSSTKDARKMFVAKLEGDGGAKTGSKKIGRSATFVVPNARNVKQLLLKWCQSKTRNYDNVDITNFSGSWANGLAFCALVHNFFPESFDYSELDAKNREHNFELAFTTAEKLANADPLLDVEDMMIMGNRPDSKCVFTYVQSLYNKLRRFEKPLQLLSLDDKKEEHGTDC